MSSDNRTPPLVNKGGRPRLSADCDSVPVSTRLPEPLYDKLKGVADRRGEPVATTLRRLVFLNLK